MKKSVFVFFAMFFLIFSTRLRALTVEKISYSLDEDSIDFQLEVKNNSDQEVILTDTNGWGISFFNDTLYVKLFAFCDLTDYFGLGAQRSNFNLRKLASGEKCVISNRFKISFSGTSQYWTDLYRIEKIANFCDSGFQAKNIQVILGSIQGDSNIEEKSGYEIFFNQKIPEVIGFEEFSKYSLKEKSEYVLKDLKYFSWEHLSPVYCFILADSLINDSDGKTNLSPWNYPPISQDNLNSILLAFSKAVSKASFLEDGKRNFTFENAVYVFEWLSAYKRLNKISLDENLFEKLSASLIKYLRLNYQLKNYDETDVNYYLSKIIGKEYLLDKSPLTDAKIEKWLINSSHKSRFVPANCTPTKTASSPVANRDCRRKHYI